MNFWDLIGIGALNWDLIYELDDLLRLKDLGISLKSGEEINLSGAELPSVLRLLDGFGYKRAESGGGQAANTAFALAKMGFKTGILGSVGNDIWGDRILDGLSIVDTSSVLSAGMSGVCISIITPDKERSMIVFPNINDSLDMAAFKTFPFSGCRFLHLTSFAGRFPLEGQIRLLNGISAGPLITFDPGNLYARFGINALLPILKKTFCLFITDTEMGLMTGLPLFEAGKRLLEMGVKMIVCKQGAKGAYLLRKDMDDRIDFPAMDVEVTDVTGAGDCFAAGFLAGLLKGLGLEQCGILATRTAASSLKGYGRDSYPDEGMLKTSF